LLNINTSKLAVKDAPRKAIKKTGIKEGKVKGIASYVIGLKSVIAFS
jgi:hypothetical protein